ncbi:MAG: hypothetical protein RL677_585 [Actinomycetota bacterium]|jgi:NaMN:DMB phosphoribosyltransferase
MGNSCLLIHDDLDSSFNNWSELSTFDLQLANLDSVTLEYVDKKIDESISSLAISLDGSSNKALAIIGIYLNLDAATLLGNSNAGSDEVWIKDCEEIRLLIKNNRDLKSEKERLLKNLSLKNGVTVLRIIQQAASRKTPVFLLGDAAIAIGYLVTRGNSQAKDFLHVATNIDRPGLIKAIENTQLQMIKLAKQTSPAKGLAIALLSHT